MIIIPQLPCKRIGSLHLTLHVAPPLLRFPPALKRNRIAPTRCHDPTIAWRTPSRFHLSSSSIDCGQAHRFNAHNSTVGGAA